MSPVLQDVLPVVAVSETVRTMAETYKDLNSLTVNSPKDSRFNTISVFISRKEQKLLSG